MPTLKLPSELQTAYLKASYTLKRRSAVPNMTSNTAPSGTASSSSNYSTAEAWWGFDTTENTWTANGTTGWLKYDFGSGVTKTIVAYSVSQGAYSGRAPYSWTFEGSNDNSAWTTLHTVTNDNSWSNYQTKNYTCSVTGAYRYYRINITLSGGASGLCEINFLGMYESGQEFYDASGNSNHLTNNNTAYFRDGYRQRYASLFVRSNSEYLSISNASQTGLNLTSTYSMFLRKRFISQAADQRIVGKWSASTGYLVIYRAAGATLNVVHNGTEYTGPVVAANGEWADYFIVYDDTADTLKWYVNKMIAKISTTATVNPSSTSHLFAVGTDATAGDYFDGQIEELHIWSGVAIGDEEVSSVSLMTDTFNRDTGGEEHLRSSASLNVKIAQSFKVKTAGYFQGVTLLGYRNNSPVGNAWVTIESDSSGAPSGTAVATSQNLDVAIPHTTAGELSFYFDNPIELAALTTYWIVLQGDYSSSSTVGIRLTRSSGGSSNYSGGAAYTYNGTSWSAISTDDFNFKVLRFTGNVLHSHFLEYGGADGQEFFSNNNRERFATNYMSTSSKSVKGVAMQLGMYGGPTGTAVIKIYSDSSGSPGSVLATSNSYARNIGWKTASPATDANSGLWYWEFDNPYTLAANTEYWISIEASSGGDGSNYNHLKVTSGGLYPYSTNNCKYYASGSWSTLSAGYDVRFALFGAIEQNAGNFLVFF